MVLQELPMVDGIGLRRLGVLGDYAIGIIGFYPIVAVKLVY